MNNGQCYPAVATLRRRAAAAEGSTGARWLCLRQSELRHCFGCGAVPRGAVVGRYRSGVRDRGGAGCVWGPRQRAAPFVGALGSQVC